MMANGKTAAYDVVKALARRHKDDMFFTEVKDGPTQVVHHYHKIDALAIKISWTNYGIIGYEIKVSRSDFLRDEKWRAYLPMCNQLYFAVAPGVCEVSEVPDNCGLVILTSKGGVRTVRKAPWRDIDEPVNMYKYLMFTYINSCWQMDGRRPRYEQLLINDRTQMYQDYLDGKTALKSLGHKVSRKVRDELHELQWKASRLALLEESDNRADKELGLICEVLGVKTYGYRRLDECLKEIEQLRASGGISLNAVNLVKQINSASGSLLAEIGGRL